MICAVGSGFQAFAIGDNDLLSRHSDERFPLKVMQGHGNARASHP
jgi:hypothetical protein